MRSAFTSHPATVGETYLGHMRFALWFAGVLFLAGGAALVHAILPFCFETTASDMLKRLYQHTQARSSQGSTQEAA